MKLLYKIGSTIYVGVAYWGALVVGEDTEFLKHKIKQIWTTQVRNN